VRKCKPQTIAGYKSAIAIVHQNGNNISSSPELSSILKGLFHKNPCIKQLTPLVLLTLTKGPFEPLHDADLK
jgi:hypothetical protein